MADEVEAPGQEDWADVEPETITFPEEFDGTVHFVRPSPPAVERETTNTTIQPHSVTCINGYDMVFVEGFEPEGETSFVMHSSGNTSSTIAMVPCETVLSASTAVSYQEGRFAVGGAATGESYGDEQRHKYLDGNIFVTLNVTDCELRVYNPPEIPKSAPIIIRGFPPDSRMVMTVCSGGKFRLVYQELMLPPK
eukprot:m.102912 g.102912  ORF g.102912 m.102912 type:complete len:194 (-) comp15548_c0_seq1:53-634(-)